MEKFDCEGRDREGKLMYGEFVKVSDVVDALSVERAFAMDAKDKRTTDALNGLIKELES